MTTAWSERKSSLFQNIAKEAPPRSLSFCVSGYIEFLLLCRSQKKKWLLVCSCSLTQPKALCKQTKQIKTNKETNEQTNKHKWSYASFCRHCKQKMTGITMEVCRYNFRYVFSWIRELIYLVYNPTVTVHQRYLFIRLNYL
jgi:hypothetical protein